MTYQTARIQDLESPSALQFTEIEVDSRTGPQLNIGERIACTGIVILKKEGEMRYVLRVLQVMRKVVEKVECEWKWNEILEVFGNCIVGYVAVKVGLVLALVSGYEEKILNKENNSDKKFDVKLFNNDTSEDKKLKDIKTGNKKQHLETDDANLDDTGCSEAYVFEKKTSMNVNTQNDNKLKIKKQNTRDVQNKTFTSKVKLPLTRFESHVLLVGGTGTGKSTLLRQCLSLTPSRFINGITTSEVGLTACAVKEDGEWSLDTGALIATDKGVCCIDSINELNIGEKNSLLEAMEQQTISVSKAGIQAKFKTSSTIIGSVTTKNEILNTNKINELENTCEIKKRKKIEIKNNVFNLPVYGNSIKKYDFNLNLSKPLLSRFDLIFYLEDDKRKNNFEIADIILDDNFNKRKFEKKNIKQKNCDYKICATKCINNNLTKNSNIDAYSKEQTIKINKVNKNEKTLASFLSSVRNRNSEISTECKNILLKYTRLKMERSGKEDLNSCRMLEGLMRLTISNGKIFGRHVTQKEDAYTAIFLYEVSIKGEKIIEFDKEIIFIDKEYFMRVANELEKNLK
ncbi:hypothetical protein COBT_003101 [Conglomerata obtusa]